MKITEIAKFLPVCQRNHVLIKYHAWIIWFFGMILVIFMGNNYLFDSSGNGRSGYSSRVKNNPFVVKKISNIKNY